MIFLYNRAKKCNRRFVHEFWFSFNLAEAMDMIKNLKPEDIKEAIKNMPPEMKEMVKGMGKLLQ